MLVSGMSTLPSWDVHKVDTETCCLVVAPFCLEFSKGSRKWKLRVKAKKESPVALMQTGISLFQQMTVGKNRTVERQRDRDMFCVYMLVLYQQRFCIRYSLSPISPFFRGFKVLFNLLALLTEVIYMH